jgi:pyridoxamine 5'-phosphate oxidase
MPPASDPRDRPTGELSERDVDPDPIRQFVLWLTEAERAGLPQPEAMALATSSVDGRPSVRMVLLKGVDERGFVFYTNQDSRKGRELAGNPHAAIAIHWQELYRQVRATGTVSPVSREESDAYFASRPRGAQLAAAASPQSRVLAGREELMEAYRRLEADLAGRDVPRPANWGGYRLTPDEVELWQGRENRLHDRLRYARDPGAVLASGWRIERLAP